MGAKSSLVARDRVKGAITSRLGSDREVVVKLSCGTYGAPNHSMGYGIWTGNAETPQRRTLFASTAACVGICASATGARSASPPTAAKSPSKSVLAPTNTSGAANATSSR